MNFLYIIGIIALGLFLLSFAVDVTGSGVECIKTGECKGVLVTTGGKLFLTDSYIGRETDFLLKYKNDNTTTFNETLNIPVEVTPSIKRMVLFDLLLNLAFFAIIIIILYKIGRWLSGSISQEPYIKLTILIFVFAIFFALSALFSILILGKFEIPLSGTFKFLVNIPNLFL